MINQITFTIPGGGAVSGNHAWKHRRVGSHISVYMTADAKRFRDQVFNIVFEAVESAGWRKQLEYCRVDVTCYNLAFDRENAVKVLHDGLEGPVFVSDRRILDGAIRLVDDLGDVRYEVTVTEVPAQWHGKKLRKKDPPPMSHQEWVDNMLKGFPF